MFEEFLKREKTIFDTLNKFLDEKLTFVVVGGYGVSAYKHRFSVDADIVISSKDAEKFEEVLRKNRFKKTITKKLENLYNSKFMRYETTDETKVSVDLFIDGVGVRQTKAAFGFETLLENSTYRTITGAGGEVKALVPKKEVLIAMKLHAGRLTDLRDVAALSKDADIKGVKGLILRGDKKRVKNHLHRLETALETKEFTDSFKGVFMEKKYDVDAETIKKICKLADEK